MKKNNKGGKVIASGGFGCVFDPALKCQGTTRREKNKISKLMIERHALKEYEEILSIREKLKNILDYENYFLLTGTNICKPGKLTKSDLTSFKEKCSALPKEDIDKDNINSKLDEMMLLNMPYGGIRLDDYLFEEGSFRKIKRVNEKLIDLLKNGILRMNELNVYHSDIKDSNVLVEEKNGEIKMRLIDWGLSVEYEPSETTPFPRSWRNRPLQFNVPFSIILFTDDFYEKYSKYLKNGGQPDPDELRPFVIDYIHYWIDKRGQGHFKFINEIMTILFVRDIPDVPEKDKELVIQTQFTMNYITNYIVEVLQFYTRFKKDGSLNLRDYLNDVFIHIVDIWGFICLYYPLLSFLDENYNRLNENQLGMFLLLKQMFIIYLYSPRTEPIDLDDLRSHLETFNRLIDNEITNTASGIVYSKNRKTRKKGVLAFRKPARKKTRKMFIFSLKRHRNKKSKKSKK
jgi:serine/threonine protein kinase